MSLPWEGIMWTLIFALSGLALMFIGLMVFNVLVPFNLVAEVENGNEAVGWLVGGFLISTGIIMGESFRNNGSLVQAVVFAVLGILLNYLGYFLWEWITPRWSLSESMKKGSKTSGLIMFGISIAIGLVVAGSFTFN